MKWRIRIGGGVLTAVLGASLAIAQQQVPDIPYEADAEFLKLPADVYFGEVAGVAVNSQRHVFVFSRGGTTGPAFGAAAAQLFEFDANGKFVREIGRNLYAFSYAHSVKVDRDDNVWIVDKGSDMVVKFNPAGKVAMVFGRKKESSDEAVPWTRVNPPRPHQNGYFRQPTDVTWDTQGNIFISDGYINSRVAKYDKNGDWVKSWGEKGTKAGEFDTPHSIASDARGNIYGTTAEGGSPGCDCGTIFKLTHDDNGNWSEHIAYRFQGVPDGAYSYYSLVSDHAGHFYGATVHGGDDNDGAIYQFTP